MYYFFINKMIENTIIKKIEFPVDKRKIPKRFSTELM
jgi:hypothetical protein